MALPKDPSYKVYDPRRGEEWLQPLVDGQCLSLLNHGFAVVEYWPGRSQRLFELEDFEELICTSIHATGALGFISVAPFTGDLEQRLPTAVEWNEASDSAIGYFPHEMDSIRRHVALLRLATYEDWVVGSCNAEFAGIPKRGVWRPVVDWNVEFLFTQVENITSASLYSSETGIVRVYTRVYSGFDEQLSRLATLRRR